MFIEHSLYGYRRTVEGGSPFVEVDCFLLKDGTLGVMHDDTLDRTTQSSGRTADQTEQSWRSLRFKIPADVAHDPQELGPPLLTDVLREFGNKAIVLVEAKNRGAGAAIVATLQKQGIKPDYVLVNSFDPEELEPALQAGFPTSLSVYGEKSAPDPVSLGQKGYAFCAFFKEISDDYVLRARLAGAKFIFYTVDRRFELAQALQRGAIGVYTDEPRYLAGGAGRLAHDPFAAQTMPHGMLPMSGQSRGVFVSPDKWALKLKKGYYAAVLHGWASPLNDGRPYREMTIRWNLALKEVNDSNHWWSLILCDTDAPFENEENPRVPLNGLRLVVSADGGMRIENFVAGKSRLLAAGKGAPLSLDTPNEFGVSYQGGKIEFWNFTQRVVVRAPIDTPPGYYLTIAAKSLTAEVSRISVTSF